MFLVVECQESFKYVTQLKKRRGLVDLAFFNFIALFPLYSHILVRFIAPKSRVQYSSS